MCHKDIREQHKSKQDTGGSAIVFFLILTVKHSQHVLLVMHSSFSYIRVKVNETFSKFKRWNADLSL